MELHDIFMLMLALNFWAVVGYLILGFTGFEADNVLEGIIGGLGFPVVLFMMLVRWINRELDNL